MQIIHQHLLQHGLIDQIVQTMRQEHGTPTVVSGQQNGLPIMRYSGPTGHTTPSLEFLIFVLYFWLLNIMVDMDLCLVIHLAMISTAMELVLFSIRIIHMLILDILMQDSSKTEQ